MLGHCKTIFEYDNYRVFLKETFEFKRALDRKYSFRYFAKIAGFKACNVLNRVIVGQRNIAPESIEKFVKALKLNKEEATYFRNLVFLNQAKNGGEKEKYAEEILKSRIYRKIYPLKESQFNFYSHWYFVVIWEAVGLPGFRDDPEWIAKHLSPPITPRETKKAIEELLKLGLLKRNENGKLERLSSNISTSDEVTSAPVARWHQEMIKRAGESISTVSREERDISSVSFAVSRSTIKKIKEKIQNFRKELVEMQKIDEGGADAVYQLNLQLFPHIRVAEEGEK